MNTEERDFIDKWSLECKEKFCPLMRDKCKGQNCISWYWSFDSKVVACVMGCFRYTDVKNNVKYAIRKYEFDI